ncbi:phospholipid phosphatase 6 [Tribolium madens]|uniref:phospholipid phosphatase 6 n=1 Tax=Tribolium madens TaxID=41895 RepID=UPI001CF72619|nr:phospholipid phosphatase 6 [Tribolium madens]
MSESGKRQVPPAMKKILNLDAEITKRFVLWANQFLPLRSLRIHYKALEITCHGIPWFAFWIAFTWLFNNPSLIQLQVNMLIGLLIDIILIAVAKAYFRRRRPIANTDDALGQIGPDVFSFPSGHASRAVFVAYFFINLWPLPIFCVPPLLAWVTAICLSRILMNRHYILDVIGGIVFGLIVSWTVSLIWLDKDSANYLMSFLSDDKIDGGDYHV